MANRPYPARVVDVEATRLEYGDRVDEILHWLWKADPIADSVAELLSRDKEATRLFYRVLEDGRTGRESLPDALAAFFEEVETVPSWVDWPRVNRAGELFFRTGIAGGIVLGAKSLCYGYCSPGGNKPLMMTGRLNGGAMHMRLVETSRYVVETCRPDGLRRFGTGFILAVRVRLMHAVVRRMLSRSEAWSDARWGVPINQHDMLGTALLFSQCFIEGVRQFGFSVSSEEANDYLHLWRYATHLMGIEPSLYPVDEDDALIAANIIFRTQGEPDADTRALIDALVRVPLRESQLGTNRSLRARTLVASGYGFCRTMLGDELSDAIDLPSNGWRHVIPAISKVVASLEPIRDRLPFVHRRLVEAGQQHWERSIEQARQGRPTTFAPPTRLAHR